MMGQLAWPRGQGAPLPPPRAGIQTLACPGARMLGECFSERSGHASSCSDLDNLSSTLPALGRDPQASHEMNGRDGAWCLPSP